MTDQAKEIERGQWGNKIDFLLSCIGYAVGLGNIWRFPYLCYRNGGGAFLIPYVIMLFIAGLPLFFFELSLGQFCSLGPTSVWRVSPLFKGVGFGMVLLSAMVTIYYNVIIMYAVYYMLVSFVSLDDGLPWERCDNEWNTQYCITKRPQITDGMNESLRLNASLFSLNTTCLNSTLESWGMNYNQLTFNITQNQTIRDKCSISSLYKTPSDEYWTYQVLGLQDSNGIGELGPISLKLILCLLLTWVVVFACLKKGVKSSGKVVYFTATFPYLMLFVLLIRGVTLPGYIKGIRFYIIPEWSRLLDIKVWADAATQIFYSLGPAFGSLITMASYNKFKNNCQRDAIIVALINCGTSIFGGFVIFAVLGFMADMTNRPVKDVATDGPGLVFIAYPEGIAQMPVAPLWSFLFFFMIFTLGLDSQFAMMETVISSISDEFPTYLRKYKGSFTFFCCLVAFLLGIPCVTKGGIYVVTLMDWYSASYGLMAVCLVELIAINYVYGIRRFSSDIKMMIGSEPNYYWKATWCVITPAAIVFILLVSAIRNTKAKYRGYTFENWAQGIGWMMVVLPLAAIFGIMIYQVIDYSLFRKSLKDVVRPTPEWGPALDKHRVSPYFPLKLTPIKEEANNNPGAGIENGVFKIEPPPYKVIHDDITISTKL